MMKANYKNWVPRGMVMAVVIATIVSLLLLLLFGVVSFGVSGALRIILAVLFGLIFLVCAAYAIWCVLAYNAFSYSGKRQLSKAIISGIADHVTLPDGGHGLDVGCGSGALAIACAKRNLTATMTGLDRWGKEYASFSKSLCEANARVEGVANVDFVQGDATRLDYPDESFDAVTSNYVYHNITGADKQKLLLETLRLLKKGGTFAIHDMMSPARYGDMNAFVEGLKKLGYAHVELIDTTNGIFMSRTEARLLMLSGSTLLVGRK